MVETAVVVPVSFTVTTRTIPLLQPNSRSLAELLRVRMYAAAENTPVCRLSLAVQSATMVLAKTFPLAIYQIKVCSSK